MKKSKNSSLLRQIAELKVEVSRLNSVIMSQADRMLLVNEKERDQNQIHHRVIRRKGGFVQVWAADQATLTWYISRPKNYEKKYSTREMRRESKRIKAEALKEHYDDILIDRQIWINDRIEDEEYYLSEVLLDLYEDDWLDLTETELAEDHDWPDDPEFYKEIDVGPYNEDYYDSF